MADYKEGGCRISTTPPDERKVAGPLAPATLRQAQAMLDIIKRRVEEFSAK
jgi:hypothetical protein